MKPHTNLQCAWCGGRYGILGLFNNIGAIWHSILGAVLPTGVTPVQFGTLVIRCRIWHSISTWVLLLGATFPAGGARMMVQFTRVGYSRGAVGMMVQRRLGFAPKWGSYSKYRCNLAPWLFGAAFGTRLVPGCCCWEQLSPREV